MKNQQTSIVYLFLVAISWLTYPVQCIPLPVTYDQRQEGQFNLHAQLENVVVVLIPAVALPELVHHLTESVPLKAAGLPTLLLKASPMKTAVKDKTLGILQRDGDKHIDILPNFPVFQVTDLPTDPDDVSNSSTTQTEERTESGGPATTGSSQPDNILVSKEKAVKTDSNTPAQVILAESPTLALQQTSSS